jgi:hypothetical protein
MWKPTASCTRSNGSLMCRSHPAITHADDAAVKLTPNTRRWCQRCVPCMHVNPQKPCQRYWHGAGPCVALHTLYCYAAVSLPLCSPVLGAQHACHGG